MVHLCQTLSIISTKVISYVRWRHTFYQDSLQYKPPLEHASNLTLNWVHSPSPFHRKECNFIFHVIDSPKNELLRVRGISFIAIRRGKRLEVIPDFSENSGEVRGKRARTREVQRVMWNFATLHLIFPLSSPLPILPTRIPPQSRSSCRVTLSSARVENNFRLEFRSSSGASSYFTHFFTAFTRRLAC